MSVAGEVSLDPAGRLELARGLLRRFEDRTGGAPAAEDARALPVAAPLAGLLPAGGLRRGSTVAVGPGPGGTSLLFALLAEATAQGAWAAVVGRPDLGLAAAAEAGVRLDRLALVPRPGADLLAVTVALLDGMDVVAVAPDAGRGRRPGPSRSEPLLRPADRTRLAARARQRGAVLVALGSWPGADLELGCAGARWHGLGEGHGRLASRRVGVRLRARVLGSGREAPLLLPGRGGCVAAARSRPAVADAEPAAVRVAG